MKPPLVVLAVSLALCGAKRACAEAAEDKAAIGDERSGSRAVPVHLIPLLDEEGQEILPDDEPAVPFSVRQTCTAECHTLDKIQHGWHFNAHEGEVPPGRPGHPWILVDAQTRTQLPLSYRSWPGAYPPDEAGLSDWRFVKQFGRHLPGGGVGQWKDSQDVEKIARAMVSGPLDINCLCCHDGDPAHDQTRYAVQIARENFRWAAASTSGFASVSGAAKDMPDTYDYLMPEAPQDARQRPPEVVYRQDVFDHEHRVFFDIVRRSPPERCYFCHSTTPVEAHGQPRWMADEDVHLAAGLICVDCHRNGIDHMITRGDEAGDATSADSSSASLSCRGCHLGDEGSRRPAGGRLGAPRPRHVGLPPVHFERMTCTACHCGEWPASTTIRVQTSLAHGLGLPQARSGHALPHILSPVFARNPQGKIAPHHLIWPAFWGVQLDGRVRPLPLDLVKQAMPATPDHEEPDENGWLGLTNESVAAVLKKLAASEDAKGSPVYVAGGKVFQLEGEGKLLSSQAEAGRPYIWPIAHDVRPAAQSLGAGGCNDCHSRSSDFFFGEAPVDSPLAQAERSVEMTSFEDVDRAYTIAFSQALRLRPCLKAVTFASSMILFLMLASYTCRGLRRASSYCIRRAD